MGNQQPSERIPLIILVITALGLPSIFTVVWSITQNFGEAAALAILSGAIFLFVSLVAGVWGKIKPELERGATESIVAFLNRQSGLRRKYLRDLVFQHRIFDTKSLSTQGTFALELERVFIKLTIIPQTALIHDGVLEALITKTSNKQDIWSYINSSTIHNFVIIGSPGSGKTTLLKHITLSLAKQKEWRFWRSRLPVLLFLRNHAQAIISNPQFSIVDAFLENIDVNRLPNAGKWFESYLNHGRCLVMLDGLDEIADLDARTKVANWVEQQLNRFGNNRFVVTSRPHGYALNPIPGFSILQISPLNRDQVKEFIDNWYLATEVMSYQKLDEGVRSEARREADELLEKIRSTPNLAELAVNPLLLTMIATVHRYRSSLPRRRVELYAEMCEVFLGKREKATLLPIELTPAQKQSVLQPLAYHMMKTSVREISVDLAKRVIDQPLRLVTDGIDADNFLKLIEQRSGLLVEKEVGLLSFAHKTFQEFLAAVHIQQEKMTSELLQNLQNDWWHETIRLFCARVDATEIITACLQLEPIPLTVLVLAVECMEEALRVQPGIRQQLEQILYSDLDSSDYERQYVAANAVLLLRQRKMIRIDENIFLDIQSVSHAEFQLFLDDVDGEEFFPLHWHQRRFSPGHGGASVTGVSPNAALAFCKWLSLKDETGDWSYRLPRESEISNDSGYYWLHDVQGVKLSRSLMGTQNFEDFLIDEHSLSQEILTQKIQLTQFDPTSSVRIDWKDLRGIYRSARNDDLRIQALLDQQSAVLDDDLLNALTRTKGKSDALHRCEVIVPALTLIFTLFIDRCRSIYGSDKGRITAALTTARDKNLYLDQLLKKSESGEPDWKQRILVTLEIRKQLDSAYFAMNSLSLHSEYNREADYIANYIETVEIVLSNLYIAAFVRNVTLDINPFIVMKQLELCTATRRWLLAKLDSLYKQKSQQSHGNQRKLWREEISQIMYSYASLAILEKRRYGSSFAVETIKTVKERKDSTYPPTL